jgi:hypothetical protein
MKLRLLAEENEHLNKVAGKLKLLLNKVMTGTINDIAPDYEAIIKELWVQDGKILGNGYYKAKWANGADYYPDRDEYRALGAKISNRLKDKVASYFSIDRNTTTVFIIFQCIPWETDFTTLT